MDHLVRRGDHLHVPGVARAEVDVAVRVDAPDEGHRRPVGRLEILLEEDAELEDRDRLGLGCQDDAGHIGARVGGQ